jgi:glycosyltransferase involved in cell wall biosynthesis
VLILVQNLPVPFDRRVWQEACTLRNAGYDVSVVCPRTAQCPAAREDLDGVHVYRYRPGHEARGLLGYVVEYTVALVAQTLLAWRVALTRRIDVVQACNPPDLLFLVALPLVLLFRARFVFDHHDVSPELLMAKGHGPRSLVVRVATALERLTFGCAVVSIATNGSYRDVAVRRGGMPPERVFVVRSGPPAGFGDAAPDPAHRRGRRRLVGYVGVMGRQEGLDYLLDAAQVIVADRGRDDVTFALAGSGPEAARLRARAAALGLAEHVHFLGRIPDAELVSLLRTADVCVNPDEANPMNDMSTMNKILEYMALARPIVQFDLREGRASAGDAALYAAPNDPVSFADAICTLLDDPGLAERMGSLGRARYERDLAWSHQVPHLLAAYERALATRPLDVGIRRVAWWRRRTPAPPPAATPPAATPSTVETP